MAWSHAFLRTSGMFSGACNCMARYPSCLFLSLILITARFTTINTQCSRVSTGNTTRPDNIPAGAPTWFANCQGFGCRVTEEYTHTKCCVENMLESELVACMANDYVHIVFSGSGRIALTSTIKANDGLILDGTWYDVVLTGATIQLTSKSIVRRIGFESSADQALNLYGHDSFVWIYKSTFGTSNSKPITIGRGFTAVSISNNKFYDSTASGAVSPLQISLRAVDQRYDQYMQISMDGNYFVGFQNQAPYIRFGYLHYFNNALENWSDYGLACSYLSRCYIENNWFSSSTAPSRNIINIVLPTDSAVGYVRMTGNQVGTGGQTLTNGDQIVSTPPYNYTTYSSTLSSSQLYSKIVANAGAGFELNTVV